MKEEIVILFDKYLSGTASDEERECLISWIVGNRRLQTQLEERLTASSDEMDEIRKQEILATIHQQIHVRRSTTFLHSFARIAAIIAFPLVLAYGAFLYYGNSGTDLQYTTVEVQRGQKSTINLPDGSKVHLNSESELIYASNYNRKERRLELKGEAYFEVAPDKDLPFIVDAGEILVQALGTEFNISSHHDDRYIRTILTKGKVKVTANEQSVYLNPNEQMDFEIKSGKLTVKKLDDARKAIGWLDNQLYFDNVTFAEVAATISRIYNVEIDFSSESLKEYRFSGSLNNNSLESVFRILSLTSPMRYEIIDNHVKLHEVLEKSKFFQQ